MKKAIKLETVNKILGYLETQTFREVALLINTIVEEMNAAPVIEDAPKLPELKEVKEVK